VLLNGCTFNRTAAITKNGGTDNVGVGGNIFNGVTTLTCSGGGNFELGDTAPEVFNSDLTVNNTAGGRFQIGINSAGNLFNGTTIINHGGSTTGLNTVIARNTSSTATFNGNVTLNCSNTVAGSGLIVGNDGTVTIKGNVTVRSTNGRGILFNSAGGGSVTLADGFSITAGTFTTGTLSFNRFTQAGTTTPQNITLTGTADITFSGNSTFNSVATFVAPQLFLNGGRFNNTTSLTKSGATTNAGTGGNIFNGSTTITSSGAGALRLANAAADDFNADVTFVSSGAGGLDPVYARATTFAGNVTVNSAAPIVVGTNGGTPTFDAGNAQTINKTGAANPTFTRMTIAKSANDVTLNTEISISTLLTFTTRYIISSSTNPVTFLDNATVAGVSNASFVSGPVRKTGNDGFIFPVGKSGFYRPIEMSMPASLTDQFTGEYFLTDPNPSFSVGSKDASINHLSRCEYWRLDRTTGSSGVSVTLSWNTTSCGVTTLPDLLVAAWDGTTWRDQGNNTATTGNTTSGTVTSLAPVSIFGPFTLGSTTTSNPLPLELISFNAKLNGNSVDLNWSTLSEKNNDYFVVERTIKGEMFETVDTVKGAGNSASTLRYASKDDYPIAGNSYYRLKQVDFDGSHTYSKLVPINFTKDGNLNFTLYPNPSSEKTSLIFRDIPEGTQEILVVVYSMSGNTLFSSVVKVGGISSDTFVLDAVSKLGSGMYIVSVACGKSIYHQKLMIN
ncbi:MAG: T9SS type A sorting domain-containing protein, partial [Bacteroidota bacterium]